MEDSAHSPMNKELFSLLTDQKILSPVDLKRFAEKELVDDDQFLGDLLVQKDVLKPMQLAVIFSKQMNIPLLKSLPPDVRPNVRSALPVDFCRRTRIFPVGIKNEELMLAVCNPLDRESIKEAEQLSEMDVKIVVIPADEAEKVLDDYFPPGMEKKTGLTRRITSKKGDSAKLKNDASDKGQAVPGTYKAVSVSSGEAAESNEDLESVTEKSDPEPADNLRKLSEDESTPSRPVMISKDEFYRVTGNKSVLFQKWENRFTSSNVIRAHKVDKREFELTSGIFKRKRR